MKRILFFVGIAAMAIGCKECPECPQGPTTAQTQLCDEEINTTIRENAEDWCDDEDIYGYHKIEGTQFERLKNEKWGTSANVNNKFIYWYDVKKKIAENTCYSNYIQFKFDSSPGPVSNASIHMELSECFYEHGSCYSIPFLLVMEKIHSLKEDDILECTIAKYKGYESVIFRLNNHTTNSNYIHFDVSDFPKFIESKSKEKK